MPQLLRILFNREFDPGVTNISSEIMEAASDCVRRVRYGNLERRKIRLLSLLCDVG